MDSLDRYRSATGSDSDSSSTFDDLQDYEVDNVASVSTLRSDDRMSGTRIIFASSASSVTTSSTIKGNMEHHQKQRHSNSSSSPSRHNRGSSSAGITFDNSPSSTKLNNSNNPSKWSNAYMSNPILLTPSKSGSKSRKITCKTAKL